MNLLSSEVIVLSFGVALLLVVATRLHRRLQNGEDFILGRRRLGERFGALSIAANAVPMWWLLLLVGAAYSTGRSAAWLALALVAGVILGGWSLAPRLRSRAQMQRFGTVSEVLAGDAGEKMYALLMRSAAVIVVTTLGVALAAQLQLAASFLGDALVVSPTTVVVMIVLVLGVTLLLSGFWLAVAADAMQIVLFVCVGTIGTAAFLIANHRSADSVATSGDWFGGQHGLLIVSYLVGIAFLIGDVAGQSSLLTRFMACKDDADLYRARRRALLATVIATLLALATGWSARAVSAQDMPSIKGFRDAILHALPSNVAAILLLLVMMAFVIAMTSGLLAAASHLANDLRREGMPPSLQRCRFALIIAVGLAAGLAVYLPPASPQVNFDRMLFCWHAIGAAFGPLLIVRLTGKRVRPGSTLGAMWSGFLLTLIFHLMPGTPGELLERALPFTAALGIALSGGERRRNPDRADRGERTIHDRLPI